MHWDGYTVFSVISGAIMVLAAIVGQGLSARDRLYGLAGGGFFAAYGVFAASQHSGTFVFPIWIFVLPVGTLIYLAANIVAGRQPEPPTQTVPKPISPQPQRAALRQSSAQQPGSSSPTPSVSAPPPAPPPARTAPDASTATEV